MVFARLMPGSSWSLVTSGLTVRAAWEMEVLINGSGSTGISESLVWCSSLVSSSESYCR